MQIHTPIISETDVVRPTQVVIDLGRLTSNFHAIKQYAGSSLIMPVLKANAYGHGLIPTARLMETLGADYLGVAVLEEGLLLRQAGITMPILILGGILGNQIPHFLKNNLTLTASSIDKLAQIEKAASQLSIRAKVHLKIDTGMERIGVHYYNAEAFLLEASRHKNIDIEGIFSHFANADAADLSYAQMQLQRFKDVLGIYEKKGLKLPLIRHIANSGAILQMPESHFDMVRPGILLYGIYPTKEVRKTIDVQPALTWKSRVVYFKVVKAGHPVGYGSTWQSNHNIRTVTVPVGYGDGFFRSMTGRAEVLISGKRYPVIGRIAMDQVIVNIETDSAYNDDEVVLMGMQQGEIITCEDLADWAGTIPYEILTNINTRVPRIYQ
ncbi:alanine racemase [bacterium]|nr:alanine racemase [bacterium]